LLTASGMVLGAAYMLYLYRRVIFGALTKEELKRLLDLSWREKAVFAPLLLLTLWMGIYPASFLDVISASVENLVSNYQTALAASEAPRLAALVGLN
jgi:NADH-quinone oxidoreductase subunit M